MDRIAAEYTFPHVGIFEKLSSLCPWPFISANYLRYVCAEGQGKESLSYGRYFLWSYHHQTPEQKYFPMYIYMHYILDQQALFQENIYLIVNKNMFFKGQSQDTEMCKDFSKRN